FRRRQYRQAFHSRSRLHSTRRGEDCAPVSRGWYACQGHPESHGKGSSTHQRVLQSVRGDGTKIRKVGGLQEIRHLDGWFLGKHALASFSAILLRGRYGSAGI